MTVMEHSIFVDASVDVIRDITENAWRMPEWYAGIVEAVPDDVFPQVGGKVELTYKVAGMTITMTQTSLEYYPGQGGAYQLEGMVNGVTRWEYTPEGDGTWVTASFEYEMSGGLLGQIADRLVVERTNDENLQKSLEGLKALAEG